MNNPPTLEDVLKLAPKQFCDRVIGNFNQESFLTAMCSGQNLTAFVFTPSHMKQLAQWAEHQVKSYEKQFGTINAQWDPNIPSPLKSSDLKKPMDDSEEE